MEQDVDKEIAEWKKTLTGHPILIAMKAVGFMIASLDVRFTAVELRKKLKREYMASECELKFMKNDSHFSTDVTSYLKDNGLIHVKDEGNEPDKAKRVALFFPTGKAIILHVDCMHRFKQRIEVKIDDPRHGAFNYLPDIVRSFERAVEHEYHDVEWTLADHGYIDRNTKMFTRLGMEALVLIALLSHDPSLGRKIQRISTCRLGTRMGYVLIAITFKPDRLNGEFPVEEFQRYLVSLDSKRIASMKYRTVWFKPANLSRNQADTLCIVMKRVKDARPLPESETRIIEES